MALGADPDSENNVAELAIDVRPDGSPTLPPTGAGDSASLGLLALSTICLGAGLVVVARRRIRSAT